MNQEQQDFIDSIDKLAAGGIVARATGREGIDLAPHSHACVQLVEAVSGTLRVKLAGREYFVPEGYACWIPAGTTHSLASHNHKIALRLFYFYPNRGKEDDKSVFSVFYVCPWALANLSFIASHGPVIARAAGSLYDYSIAFFHTFVVEESKIDLPLKGIDVNTPLPLKRAMTYLHTHLATSVRAGDVAQWAGVSVRTLSRLFKEAGTTLSDYLCYQRVISALELMAGEAMTVKEIAYSVGFSTPANFNRAFKQVMGMSPTEMKKHHQAT